MWRCPKIICSVSAATATGSSRPPRRRADCDRPRALGCIRACLRAVRRVRRGAGGVRSCRSAANKGVAFPIADLDVMAAAAHHWCTPRGDARCRAEPRALNRAAAIAKLYATESAVTATRVATQVFAVTASWRSTHRPSDRDAKVLEIGEGHLGGSRLLIARRLGCRWNRFSIMSESTCPRADSGADRPVGRQAGGGDKLFVRDRDRFALRPGHLHEDGHWPTPWPTACPPTGGHRTGLVQGRPALVVANDPSVKAGSWGARTSRRSSG